MNLSHLFFASFAKRPCTELTILSSWGQFTSLDVSKNTALTSLSVSSIQLTSLDVSKNTALSFLSISGPFTSDAINALLGTLHNNTVPPATDGSRAKTISIYTYGAVDYDRSIAERKGWTVR